METKFEIGDVVRVKEGAAMAYPEDCGCEATVTYAHELESGRTLYSITCNGHHTTMLNTEGTLVRRASAQREGGFAVGQRVRLVGYAPHINGQVTTVLQVVNESTVELAPVPAAPVQKGWTVRTRNLEPADPAPAQQECGCTEGACVDCAEPPQPAPMTRAARVLAGMERDVYADHERKERYVIRNVTNEQKERNEAARLRMAKMSLDRPLDAERARWERLALAKVPVGRR